VLIKAPDAPVHALVVPKLHVADYFVLPEKMCTVCWLVAERVCGLFEGVWFGMEGVRFCVEVGWVVDLVVKHVTILVIPRCAGSAPNLALGSGQTQKYYAFLNNQPRMSCTGTEGV